MNTALNCTTLFISRKTSIMRQFLCYAYFIPLNCSSSDIYASSPTLLHNKVKEHFNAISNQACMLEKKEQSLRLFLPFH